MIANRDTDHREQPTGSASDWAGLALTGAQFGLLLLIVQRFSLETAPFRTLFAFCVAAFAVHYATPARVRMWSFLLISIAGTAIVLGMDKGTWRPDLAIERAGWIVAVLAIIVAVCYSPFSLIIRVLTLLVIGAVLVVMRSGLWPGPVPAAIWPILGSMVMFRVAALVYDLRHGHRPKPHSALAYLVMIPNVCFPLFPVVDFRAFCRSLADRPDFLSHQVGLSWIFRGLVQLLLYRAVYYEVYIDASQVGDGADLARYLLTNYLLYLRVSGQFHVIIGLLRLFGFALPETHRRYYLATSFTDYWRRINIYWKDYIMKLVFYPVIFRLKRMPQAAALAIATMVAFIATWALHSWQWFWLRGTFPVAVRDIAFWGVLALLVTVNSVWEARRGRRRTLGPVRPTLRSGAAHGVKAAATFLVICLLWSIWTCQSLGDWFEVLSFADVDTAIYAAAALAVVFAASFIPESKWASGTHTHAGPGFSAPVLRWAVVTVVAPALLLGVLSLGRVNSRLGEQFAAMVRLLRNETRPHEGDVEILERGYYEELIDTGLVNSALSEVFMTRPADWRRLEQTPAMRLSGAYTFRELVPSLSTTVNGVEYRTNSAGLRDREYEEQTPPGARRLAFIGASFTMGWGVEKADTFESVVEERLNAQPGAAPVELLNFAVNGYSPVCQLVVVREQVARFRPRAVLYFAHDSESFWTVNRLARAVRDGAPMPGDFPARVAAEAGVRAGTPQPAGERRLAKRGPEVVAWAYQELAAACREIEAVPFWVYIPKVGGPEDSARFEELRSAAERAGFEIIDLRGAFAGQPMEKLIIAPWDRHPNAEGHRLLAERLFSAMLGHDRLKELLGTP